MPACGMVMEAGLTDSVASPAAWTIAIWAVLPALSVTIKDRVISSIVVLAGNVNAASAQVLDVYTTWNTDTNVEVALHAPAGE